MATITIYAYADIASSLDLWRQYIDPCMAFSDKEFKAMSLKKRIALIVETYGPESTDASSCNE